MKERMQTSRAGTWSNPPVVPPFYKGGKGGILGFTLIELVVALFIVGLVTLLSFPRVQHLFGDDLRGASRHLIGTIRYLYNEASASKRIYRLNYDLAEKEYWVTVLDEEGKFISANDTLAKRTFLPKRIQFQDIYTLHNGKVMEGVVFTQFYPEGRVDRTVIHLKESDKNLMTLIVNPLTGKVSVHDKYVEIYEGK